MSRTTLKGLLMPMSLLFGMLYFSGCGSNDTPNEDIVEGGWEEFSSLPTNFRTHHSYAFSINGVGYIVGGQALSGPRKDFYSYDPAQDEWTDLGDYPGPHRGYGIGDVANGKAYFGFGFGINDDYLKDFWVYDPSDNSWQELAECPCSARIHPALVHLNGKIYVGMGEDANNNDLKDWWEYDIATDSWSQKTSILGDVRHHPYQFAIGNYVYAGFGHHGMSIYKDWYRYDPATDSWERMADLPGEGRVAGGQFSHKGMGYVISGEGETHDSMPTGEFWRYDPAQNAWEQLPPHPGSSRWAPSTFIVNDVLYIINGEGSNALVGEGYKYQLD